MMNHAGAITPASRGFYVSIIFSNPLTFSSCFLSALFNLYSMFNELFLTPVPDSCSVNQFCVCMMYNSNKVQESQEIKSLVSPQRSPACARPRPVHSPSFTDEMYVHWWRMVLDMFVISQWFSVHRASGMIKSVEKSSVCARDMS